MRPSDRPLIDEFTIRRRVAEMAREISADYKGRELTFLVVLKGGVVFGADLCRAMRIPVRAEFVRAQSYVGAESTGTPTIEFLFDDPLEGRNVLIVEDILDTGRTTSALFQQLEAMNPASLGLCVFLNKPIRRIIEVPLKYTGYTLGNRFVVGYGLDYNQQYRNLPAIYDMIDDEMDHG
jgi:hypoxanthine phosphoribosyltransferase